jgi:hypothetical protein
VVSWSPKEDAILVSGAYDKRLVLFDARAPQNSVIIIHYGASPFINNNHFQHKAFL